MQAEAEALVALRADANAIVAHFEAPALAAPLQREAGVARIGVAHDVAHRLARDAQHVLGLPRCEDGDQLAVDLHRKVRSPLDRKSTRLNSGHTVISYAVFFLKKNTT